MNLKKNTHWLLSEQEVKAKKQNITQDLWHFDANVLCHSISSYLGRMHLVCQALWASQIYTNWQSHLVSRTFWRRSILTWSPVMADLARWHFILGHFAFDKLKKLAKKGEITKNWSTPILQSVQDAFLMQWPKFHSAQKGNSKARSSWQLTQDNALQSISFNQVRQALWLNSKEGSQPNGIIMVSYLSIMSQNCITFSSWQPKLPPRYCMQNKHIKSLQVSKEWESSTIIAMMVDLPIMMSNSMQNSNSKHLLFEVSMPTSKTALLGEQFGT